MTIEAKLVILGKLFGTFSDWDEGDSCELSFYGVDLNDEAKEFLACKDIYGSYLDRPIMNVNFNKGTFTLYHKDDEEYTCAPDWNKFLSIPSATE